MLTVKEIKIVQTEACEKYFKCKEDHRSYRRNFAVMKRKPESKKQACMGLKPLTSAIPVHCPNQFS